MKTFKLQEWFGILGIVFIYCLLMPIKGYAATTETPENIQKMAPVMMEGNWLLIYADLDGIDRVLAGMNRRTKNRSRMDKAGRELKEFYTLFEADFKLVMKDLQTLSGNFLADNNIN